VPRGAIAGGEKKKHAWGDSQGESASRIKRFITVPPIYSRESEKTKSPQQKGRKNLENQNPQTFNGAGKS